MAFTELIARLGLDATAFTGGMDAAVSKLGNVASNFTTAGAGLTAAITVPLAGIALAAFNAANSFDEASDRIRAGTGATGATLKSLEQSFKTVFVGVPASTTEVSTAIADLNTRLGLTGQPLENMATQMLNLARLTGTEVGPLIASTTRAFGDWSIETEKQSGALDFLFKTSQSTGIGVDKLTNLVVQFGAPLRALGFDFETAAATMGRFEKDGVNLETVMSGLRFALGKFAKEGITDMEGAFRGAQEAIKGAKTESEATGIAFQIFGQRAAVDMSRAIIEGRFEVDQLVKSLNASGETINKAAADTLSFGEKWTLFKNKLTAALEPLGVTLIDALTRVLEFSSPMIAWLSGMVEWFGQLDPWVQTIILGVGGLAAAIGPLLVAAGALAAGISALLPAFTAVAGIVTGAAFLAALKAIAIAVAAAAAAWALWEFGKWLSGLEPVQKALDVLINAHAKLWEWIQKIPGMATAVESIKDAGAAAKKKFDELVGSFTDTKEQASKLIKETNSLSGAQKTLKDRADKLTGSIDGLLGKKEQLFVKYPKLTAEAKKLWQEMDKQAEKTRIATRDFEQWKNELETTSTQQDQVRALTAQLAAMGTEADRLKQFAVPVFETQLPAALKQAKTDADAFQGALATLGIKGSADAQKIASEAAKARDAVLGSDLASDFEKKTAVFKALEAQVEAARQAGEKIPASQLALLDKMKQDVEGKLPGIQGTWKGFADSVSTSFGSAVKDMASAFLEGDLSFGEKFEKLAGSLKTAFLDTFLKPITDGINSLITGVIADLLGSRGLGGISGALSRIVGLGGGAAGSVGGAAGQAAGGVGGAGGAVGSAVGAGLSGTLGAVFGGVSAASGVISNFQMAGMNKSLDIIVLHTLQTANQLRDGLQPQINEYLPKLESIADYLWTVQTNLLGQINDAIRFDLIEAVDRVATKIEQNNTFNISGSSSDDIATKIAAKLRLQGVAA